jgi:protein JSN1
MQQLQYQQSLLARAAPSMNNYYPNMQSSFGGYNNSSPSIDHYRNQGIQNGSPIQPPPPQMSPSPMLGQNSFSPPSFGTGISGYGYPGISGMQNMNYMHQQEQVNGRRGRR